MSRGGELDWGTVERSDVPFSAVDTAGQPEVLEVPELTDEMLDRLDNDVTETPTEADTGPEYAPGSQVDCPNCGRNVRVRKDGQLSSHKCEAKPGRGDRLAFVDNPRRKNAPSNVRKFGIGIVSWAVEEGSAHVLARPFGIDPDDVPSELPDPELMIGAPLDIIWPDIPDGAQKFIERIADNSDLIACALAWGEWLSTVGGWTRDMRKYQESLRGGAQHGSQVTTGEAFGGTVLPFQPTAD